MYRIYPVELAVPPTAENVPLRRMYD